jgi:DnaJ-class molecular chaperone
MEKKRTFIEWLKYLKRKNAKVKNFVKPLVMCQVCPDCNGNGYSLEPAEEDCIKCETCNGKGQTCT